MKTATQIILASKSPRRKELLGLMGYDFKVEIHDVDESYPTNLSADAIAIYISEKKAKAFTSLQINELVITADTIVCVDELILGKPADAKQAKEMLLLLSDRSHEVITAVTLMNLDKMISFCDRTSVEFKKLTETEIDYYIAHFQPYDKAGSYGIQEWIGLIGVKSIHGSYTNVMGLPTEKLATQLAVFISE